jgi:O-antigen ligase
VTAFRKISLIDVSAIALAAVAIQLPVYHLYISLTIGAWILLSFLSAAIRRDRLRANFGIIVLILFYGLVVLSKNWSENKGVANFDMEVKMSFAIIPFIMLFVPYQIRQLKIILYAFFIGVVFGTSLLLVESFMDYLQTKSFQEFFYVELSTRIHPSYFSYYLNIGISILLIDYMGKTIRLFNKNWIYLLLIFGMSAFSFLLVSKNGIIVTLLLFAILLIYWLIKKKFLLVIGLTVLMTTLTTVLYMKSENLQQRATELFMGLSSDKADSQEYSTGLRLAIWKESITLIKKEPIIGYGSGDVTDALLEQYDKKGLSVALIRRLNAHNQFLQTTLAHGLIGFILLAGILLFPFFRRDEGKWFGIALSLITIAFFLTESVLETQAGVVSFLLFYTLLISVRWEKNHLVDKNELLTE